MTGVPSGRDDRAIVPCAGCRVCCINDAIILHPECGDDVSAFDAVAIKHPLTGKPAMMLKHKANGECVYLGASGCTIHDRAPAICREYDCRKQYLAMPRSDRRRLVALGYMRKDQFNEGRKRAHTLGGA